MTVQDTGPGIGADMLPHVFERFYRAHSGDDGQQGNGIGLAIAKTIVDAHDAEISVESQPGVGTMVRVSFARRLLIGASAPFVGVSGL